MLNAGSANWQQCGAMEYLARMSPSSAKRLAAAARASVLCVLHAQGQVQLEARCAGVQKGLGSERAMSDVVNGLSRSTSCRP